MSGVEQVSGNNKKRHKKSSSLRKHKKIRRSSSSETNERSYERGGSTDKNKKRQRRSSSSDTSEKRNERSGSKNENKKRNKRDGSIGKNRKRNGRSSSSNRSEKTYKRSGFTDENEDRHKKSRSKEKNEKKYKSSGFKDKHEKRQTRSSSSDTNIKRYKRSGSIEKNEKGSKRSGSIDKNDERHIRSNSIETNNERYKRSESIDKSEKSHRRRGSMDKEKGHKRSSSIHTNEKKYKKNKPIDKNEKIYERSRSINRNEKRYRRSWSIDTNEKRFKRSKSRDQDKSRYTRNSSIDRKDKSNIKKTDDENIDYKPILKEELLTTKTGGAYIPPAKLRLMQAELKDKNSSAYQRIAWEALKKSIHGFINKVNTSNIGPITRDLLKENIVRGRGLLARSIIQAQAASITFTPVYAALVAVINSKFPNIGELIVKRLAIQFKRGFKRNSKALCISSATFIAHLVNQGVAHEILILEILTLLVQTPTDDSIEIAIAILKEVGMKLTQVCRKGIEAIFEMLRNILHEGHLDKRVQYMIEVVFQIRKDGFKDHEAVNKDLDLVEEEDQMTHLIALDEATDSQDMLNVFKFDAEYLTNEEKYKELSKDILNSDSDDDDEGSDEEDDDDENAEDDKIESGGLIIDNTETNLTALRRTIYLTIHSSLDFEECAHKLLKMQLKPGQEMELCHMFLDCCAEMRTYEKFFGLLAGRFCAINRIYIAPFEEIFKTSYNTIHRLDTNRLRNVAKFFAHLLMTDSISWAVLSEIKLNEDDTTSSSRVFIKILFQELSEYMGLPKLNDKLKDEEMQEAFNGLFPKDDPRNTRFAINFFTSIGLGGLTDDLREFLKNRPKKDVPSVKKEP